MIDKVIYVPTVQHTGTWFAIDFLRGHSHINNKVYEWRHWRNNEECPLLGVDTWDIVQVHVGSCWGNLVEPKEVYDGSEDFKCKHPMILDMFVKTFPTIVPIRDPLRAIITRETRHPELNHNYIVNGFIYLRQVLDRIGQGIDDVHFLPIDSNLQNQKRYDLLCGIIESLGLPYEPYLEKYAQEWKCPPYNSTMNMQTDLKSAYNARDIKKIQKLLPLEWEYLQRHEDEVRPLMEHLGYKDLLWYS